MTEQNGVATYTEFNRVCLRNGIAPTLRAYYMLRHTSENGRGWHPYEAAVAVLVDRLGITEKRATQLLAKGSGLFWTLSGEFVYLFSVAKVGDLLEVNKEGYTVYLPEEVFEELRTFKAYLYASWFAQFTRKMVKYITVNGERVSVAAGYKSISRAALRELFGVTRQTQAEYEHITNMDVQPQVKRYEPGTDIPLPEHILDGGRGGVYGFQDPNSLWIYKQTSNRFAINLPAKRGKRRVKPKGGLSSKHEAEADRFYRYYFVHRKSAETAVSKGRAPLGEVCVYTGRAIRLTKNQTFHILDVVR